MRVPHDHTTIAGALQASSPGDTVVISCGTYAERNLFLKPGVLLRSETGDPNCVTIDAGGLGTVFVCRGLHAGTSMEGMTIIGGHADGVFLQRAGGAIHCEDSSISIADCVFRDNTAEASGGALYFLNSSPTISGSVFTSNHARQHGGAVELRDSSVVLANCSFVGNRADWHGGALGYDGHSDLTISGCRFRNNSSDHSGGAILTTGGTHFILANTEFVRNTSAKGGAVTCFRCRDFDVSDCVFLRNAAQTGGAVAAESAGFAAMGCTFSQNEATSAAPAVYGLDCGQFAVYRCLLTSNTGPQTVLYEGQGEPSVSRCIFFENSATDEAWFPSGPAPSGKPANLRLDPGLCDASASPVAVRADSPCLKTNNPWGIRVGAVAASCPGATGLGE